MYFYCTDIDEGTHAGSVLRVSQVTTVTRTNIPILLAQAHILPLTYDDRSIIGTIELPTIPVAEALARAS